MVAFPYLFAGSAGTGTALAAALRTIFVSCDFKIMIVIRKLMTIKRHSCQSRLRRSQSVNGLGRIASFASTCIEPPSSFNENGGDPPGVPHGNHSGIIHQPGLALAL
jgi:hypothetical protein